MSDPEVHEHNEDHVRPVALEDIPRHTWIVTTADGGTREITTHMALRPEVEFDAWRFVEFVDVEKGWRIENTIDIIASEDLTSLVWLRPDGTRKEMIG